MCGNKIVQGSITPKKQSTMKLVKSLLLVGVLGIVAIAAGNSAIGKGSNTVISGSKSNDIAEASRNSTTTETTTNEN